MTRIGVMRIAVLAALLLSGVATKAPANFVPWEPLVADSWIYYGPPQARLLMHTVNGSDYEVGFDQARSDDSARGMKALKFSHNGANTGHLVSPAWHGSFVIQNTGDARTFSDLVIAVAIDATALPPGFALSLGVAGTPAYVFDPAGEIGYYDHPEYATGRPSGFYSVTSPSGEGLSYAFAQGMVTTYAVEGAALGPGGSITVDYAFAALPGTAVFSVYGEDANVGWVYHTNRSVIDANRPAEPVSTFEVMAGGVDCVRMGDVNGDGVLDATDIAAYMRVKMGSPDPGDHPPCADYGTGTLEGDTAMFIEGLLGA